MRLDAYFSSRGDEDTVATTISKDAFLKPPSNTEEPAVDFPMSSLQLNLFLETQVSKKKLSLCVTSCTD